MGTHLDTMLVDIIAVTAQNSNLHENSDSTDGSSESELNETTAGRELTRDFLEDRDTLIDLAKFRDDPCPFFARAATDKDNEVTSYVAELRNDRVEVRYTEKISETLEFLFCETDAEYLLRAGVPETE